MFKVAVGNGRMAAGVDKAVACLAVAASAKNSRVLVIDLDPDASATSLLGFSHEKRAAAMSLVDVLASGSPEVLRSATRTTRFANVDVVFAPSGSSSKDWIDATDPGSENLLKRALLNYSEHDLVIIACPEQNNRSLMYAGLAAAQQFIPVTDGTEWGHAGLRQLPSALAHFQRNSMSFLPVPGYVDTHADCPSFRNDSLPWPVLASLPPSQDIRAELESLAVDTTTRLWQSVDKLLCAVWSGRQARPQVEHPRVVRPVTPKAPRIEERSSKPRRRVFSHAVSPDALAAYRSGAEALGVDYGIMAEKCLRAQLAELEEVLAAEGDLGSHHWLYDSPGKDWVETGATIPSDLHEAIRDFCKANRITGKRFYDSAFKRHSAPVMTELTKTEVGQHELQIARGRQDEPTTLYLITAGTGYKVGISFDRSLAGRLAGHKAEFGVSELLDTRSGTYRRCKKWETQVHDRLREVGILTGAHVWERFDGSWETWSADDLTVRSFAQLEEVLGLTLEVE